MSVERVDLHQHGGALVEEHLARYRFALTLVGGKRVLDLACGSGYGTAMLADAGAREVVGVDISQQAVESARTAYARPNAQFQVGNAEELSELADASFDLCVSFETIEHLPDVPKYLSAVHRVLKGGGKYLVSTPNRRTGGLTEQLTGRPNNKFHVREFTGRELRHVMGDLFRIDQLYGQNVVGRALGNPLVQFPAKIVLKLLGMTETKKRYYHEATGATVVPIDSAHRYPRYILALATKK